MKFEASRGSWKRRGRWKPWYSYRKSTNCYDVKVEGKNENAAKIRRVESDEKWV